MLYSTHEPHSVKIVCSDPYFLLIVHYNRIYFCETMLKLVSLPQLRIPESRGIMFELLSQQNEYKRKVQGVTKREGEHLFTSFFFHSSTSVYSWFAASAHLTACVILIQLLKGKASLLRLRTCHLNGVEKRKYCSEYTVSRLQTVKACSIVFFFFFKYDFLA